MPARWATAQSPLSPLGPPRAGAGRPRGPPCSCVCSYRSTSLLLLRPSPRASDARASTAQRDSARPVNGSIDCPRCWSVRAGEVADGVGRESVWLAPSKAPGTAPPARAGEAGAALAVAVTPGDPGDDVVVAVMAGDAAVPTVAEASDRVSEAAAPVDGAAWALPAEALVPLPPVRTPEDCTVPADPVALLPP